MKKVLITGNHGQQVHLIRKNFIKADETICGERLHGIGTTYIINKKIPVTCKKCIFLDPKFLKNRRVKND